MSDDIYSQKESVVKVLPKTRSERMAQEGEKHERIKHYLRHGKHLCGLTKNQQRIVRRQAKNYFFEETSKILRLFCVVSLLLKVSIYLKILLLDSDSQH